MAEMISKQHLLEQIDTTGKGCEYEGKEFLAYQEAMLAVVELIEKEPAVEKEYRHTRSWRQNSVCTRKGSVRSGRKPSTGRKPHPPSGTSASGGRGISPSGRTTRSTTPRKSGVH